MKHLLGLLTCCTALLASCAGGEKERNAITCPLESDTQQWELMADFSDEFDSTAIDQSKWEYKLSPWGVRSWSSDCVEQNEGKLRLSMRYEEHQMRGVNYFYKMGIARSRKKTTYGYYEARIKAASVFPGVCPAFWLYSFGEQMEHKGDTLTYSEIDIVELTQGEGNKPVNKIDCNLHMRKKVNGQEVWQRPNTHPEMCQTYWMADFDPRDDFHIYACENRPDSIIFYVDNQRIGAKENLYWHLPMNVTFTMEPRMPHHKYQNGDRLPVPEAATPEGYPTTMEVDWVRAWRKL